MLLVTIETYKEALSVTMELIFMNQLINATNLKSIVTMELMNKLIHGTMFICISSK
jgi:hypothetical protein